MTTRAEIVSEARRWIDTPWKHQARLRGIGVDCIGVIVAPARAAGLDIADVTDYSRQANPARSLELLRERMDEIGVQMAREGDVIFLWFEGEDRPHHFALLTDIGILHAYENARSQRRPTGKVVETRLPIGWANKIHSAWRFRGLKETA